MDTTSTVASRMPTLANLINPRSPSPVSSTPQPLASAQPEHPVAVPGSGSVASHPPVSTPGPVSSFGSSSSFSRHPTAHPFSKQLPPLQPPPLPQPHQVHSQHRNHITSWSQPSLAPHYSFPPVHPLSSSHHNLRTQAPPPNSHLLGRPTDRSQSRYIPHNEIDSHPACSLPPSHPSSSFPHQPQFPSSSSSSSSSPSPFHSSSNTEAYSHHPRKRHHLLPSFGSHSENFSSVTVAPSQPVSSMPPHANLYDYPSKSEERDIRLPTCTFDQHGRSYAETILGKEIFPCDEKEQERLDIYHMVFKVALNHTLHQVPLPPKPRILDLGCGTGIWALEMGEQYKDAEIAGIDLIDVQPKSINHPNVRFYTPRDMEDPESYLNSQWDMIHLRMAAGNVKDWRRLYQIIFNHLTPGEGWFEHVEIDLRPRCNDQSLSQDSDLAQWFEHLCNATARAGRVIAYPNNTRVMLENAGFTDIQEKVIRAPLNGWPADPRESGVGRWYNLGLVQGGGIESLSLAAFCRYFKWDEETEVRPFLKRVEHEMGQSRIHAYHNIHVWTARRPVQ